jgi:hypothetical protein
MLRASATGFSKPTFNLLNYSKGYFRNDLIPNASDGYTLSQLGTNSTGGIVVDTGYIKYTVNGFGQGALGNTTLGVGIMFDTTGTGNYGVDDMFRPGTPWEAYALFINDSYYLGGSDGENYPSGTHYFTQTTKIWNLSANNVNHIVCLKGSESTGFVVLQYMTVKNELAIRIRLSYTNTTGSAVTVKASREVDPDTEANSTGSYATNNYRGYGSLSSTSFVYGQGTTVGKILALYALPTSYTRNTSVYSGWPLYNFTDFLSGRDNGNGDHGIAVAWDAGSVAAGATVHFDCAYICGLDIAKLAKTIG